MRFAKCQHALVHASRLFHTVRHLRPVQIYSRLWFQTYRPTPDLTPAPEIRVRRGRWQHPARHLTSLLNEDAFRFLNERHAIEAPSDWNHPTWEKLWLYNLHCFEDLNAEDAEDRTGRHRALIARWLAENPPAVGIGWEPYPISMRLVNWIKWALAGNPLAPAWVRSLAVQARHLRRRLEYHLLGNHLLANAKALVFASLFFGGDEARRWLEKGLAVLDRELNEQILPDGGYFELSPMYHSVVLEDLLDLLNLLRAYPDAGVDPAWEARLRGLTEAMHEWLAVMCHPDGEIALFNDAAFGIACPPAELDAYAARLGLPDCAPGSGPVRHLADAGYIRLDQGVACALLDVARIGPDYIPGHAHADTLSFELSLFGRRVLVNSGTSRYGTSPERERQRGTAAHNTVVIDRQDSSEVWSGFRVARRARPKDLQVESVQDGIQVYCSHNGYRRLPGSPLHKRRWKLGQGCLAVRDEIEGPYTEAQARFYFHPDISVEIPAGCSRGRLRMPGGQAVGLEIRAGSGVLEKTTYYPRFGVSEPNSCLCISLSEQTSEVEFHWD